MANEITIPSPGESITQVQIARWLVQNGDEVEKDQEVVEIDSDKASFPLAAPVDGIITLQAGEGETIKVGAVIATVEEVSSPRKKENTETVPAKKEPGEKVIVKEEANDKKGIVSPLAEKMMEEKKLSRNEVASFFSGKRVTKKDVETYIRSKKEQKTAETTIKPAGTRDVERRKLSPLRLKLAERLVAVKNQTAMLTTFNEVNMKKVMEIRARMNDSFRNKFGVGLGFMSFFTKAVTLAIRDFPQVNSMIEGTDLVIPGFADIGIAVSAPKGLLVPVLKNAEMMSFAEIESRISVLAEKARENRISLDDMQGGTFTITNGGVFGSLMSTPILNPPQSAILGMHKIIDRAVVIDGKIEIRPMMYLALSYDHRVIDGSEAVGFLVKIKEYIEDPVKMLTEGEDPLRLLLDL
jgi:2-oxoglutarate dehydrogenase E2 component (dihydrolipoamide succinyltransferase)